MNQLLLSKIEHLIIPETATITAALKQMDFVDKKLLIVVDATNSFKSIISVGDIQRNLIKKQDFNTKVSDVLRADIKTSYEGQEIEQIQKEMLKFRMELMPVLSQDNRLIDVIFWEDIFKEKHSTAKGTLEIPVVIMAGGKGTRLKPITNIIPKPLIPIGEKSIAEHIIEKFVASGSKTFYLTVNYKSEMIKAHFKTIKDKVYTIKYLEEKEPRGTAGSLSLLKNEIKTTFFVSNCDILINQDYEEVYKYHIENKNELTLVAALKNYPIPYGTLNLTQDGLLKSIEEKPEHNILVNAGLYIVEPELLDEIPENIFYHITQLMEKILERNGRIGVFPVSEASWMDMGNWVEYNETLKRFGEKTYLNNA